MLIGNETEREYIEASEKDEKLFKKLIETKMKKAKQKGDCICIVSYKKYRTYAVLRVLIGLLEEGYKVDTRSKTMWIRW